MIGGYYVKYPSGYESWSPAEDFEDGYTLLEEEEDKESPSFKFNIGDKVRATMGGPSEMYVTHRLEYYRGENSRLGYTCVYYNIHSHRYEKVELPEELLQLSK